MESADYKEEKKPTENTPKSVIHTKTIRAGKRTYFFDVKSTRNNEYYLTITESKRKYDEDGKFYYEKHKLFLYPEDFDKFANTLKDIINYIDENNPGPRSDEQPKKEEASSKEESDGTKDAGQEEVIANIETDVRNDGLTDIDFEDI